MVDFYQYVSLTTMMVLATLDEEGNPYTSNMYFKSDGENNFYFKSKHIREHSQHIEKDSRVAWSILNTEKYQKTSKDKKWLQFQGTAVLLTGKEAEEVQEKLYEKKLTFFEMLQNGHMIYKCTPNRVKIWDEELYGGQGKIIEF